MNNENEPGRRPNFKDKVEIVIGCLRMILEGLIKCNVSQIQLAWMLMVDGIQGHCYIVTDLYKNEEVTDGR